MHLDDVENETAPRVEQYLSKIKVIRSIAGKIIDFLAQLEDFQKKLWLKKKFVVETQLLHHARPHPRGVLPGDRRQRRPARGVGAALRHRRDQGRPDDAGIQQAAQAEFLKAHPTLVVDTRHFDADFIARLLERSAMWTSRPMACWSTARTSRR